MTKSPNLFAAAAAALIVSASAAHAATVKITPLGSHDGEFCRFDRAIVFEDPDETRILYDAGRTVAGANDPRLGKIDAVLVSHMHGDHVGDRHIPKPNAGTCSKPDMSVKVAAVTNTVNIAKGKGAKIITGSEMPRFFGAKLKGLGGNPKDSQLVRFGANRKVGGVSLTTVPATHSNGVNGAFIGGDLGKALSMAGLTAYAGPPTGYVVKFSNGLVAYLSGDTGMTAEQDYLVRRHYKANLAVINIGDVFTTGPKEAAYVINEMVKPAAVIPSHANQVSTKNGKIASGTRLESFAGMVKVPVHVPLSGKTMEFDGAGKCVNGC